MMTQKLETQQMSGAGCGMGHSRPPAQVFSNLDLGKNLMLRGLEPM